MDLSINSGSNESTSSSTAETQPLNSSMRSWPSFENLVTTPPTVEGSTTSHHYYQNWTPNDPQALPVEPHPEWEPGVGTSQQHVEQNVEQYQQQQPLAENSDYSAFIEHYTEKLTSYFESQEHREKSLEQEKGELRANLVPQNLMMEQNQGIQGQDEVNQRRPTYSELMEENQGLRNQITDLHQQIESANQQLANMTRDKQLSSADLKAEESDTETWLKNIVGAVEEDENLNVDEVEEENINVNVDEVEEEGDKLNGDEAENEVINVDEVEVEIEVVKEDEKKDENLNQGEELRNKNEETKNVDEPAKFMAELRDLGNNLRRRYGNDNGETASIYSSQIDAGGKVPRMMNELAETSEEVKQDESKADVTHAD